MQKLTAIILIGILSLSGCAFPGVYKINVQQGNIVTDEELTELSEGMPRSQVHAVLGSPLMLNPFDPSREYYVYTFQRRGSLRNLDRHNLLLVGPGVCHLYLHYTNPPR